MSRLVPVRVFLVAALALGVRLARVGFAVVVVGPAVFAASAGAAPSLVGGPVQVNPDPAGDQCCTDAAMAPDGHFAVAYQEQNGGNPDVFVRLFSSTGGPTSAGLPINGDADGRQQPALGMAADGRMVVVYSHAVNSGDVVAQRLDSAGTLQGSEIAVHQATSGTQQAGRVAVAPDGRFVVVWADVDTGIKARLYSADGAPLTGELPVSQSGGGFGAPAVDVPAVAVASTGRFVVVWQISTTFGENGKVMARRYGADGTAQGGEFAALTGDMNQNLNDPAVGLADDGGMLVAASGTDPSAVRKVVAQRLDLANVPQGAAFQVNDYTGYSALAPKVAMDSDGNSLIVWTQAQPGGGVDAALKQYADDGLQQGDEINGVGGSGPSIALDGTARAAVAYDAADGPGANPGVFARRVSYSAPPSRTLTVTTSGSGTGTVAGAGIDCGGAGHVDCSESVADGATITLTATAASGSAFGAFSGGGCPAASPCTVTMDADKTVDARFDPPSPPGGDTTSTTPPPTTSGPSDPTGQPPSPAAPTVTSLRAAAPIVSGHRALLTAQVAGSAQRLEWDVTGDGKTDVSCGGDQTTLAFRPPSGGRTARSRAARAGGFTGVVSVRAVGVAGTGPVLSQTLSVTPGPAIAGDPKLLSQIAAVLGRAPPVYACGLDKDLPAATSELSLADGDAVRDAFCLRRTIVAGTLVAEGCFKPIRKLNDIPPAERGIVQGLARLLRFPVKEGTINARLGPAFSLSDAWVAVGSILVNGVELEPQDGARIVFYPQANQIVSSNAAMSVGGIKLANRRDFSLDTKPTSGGVIPVGQFRRLPSPTKSLGDFPLTGDVGVVLKPGTAAAAPGAEITATLVLPSFLDVGGAAGQAKVRLGVTTDGQLALDDMNIGPLEADIGSLQATDLRFNYLYKEREWKGRGDLCPKACLDAKIEDEAKRNAQEFAAAMMIHNGELQSLVNLTFPRPGFELFSPGVYLSRINASIGLDPTRLVGSATATAGIFDISGSLALAFPSAAAPFGLTREELGNNFPTELYGARTSRFTVAAAGDASLNVPLVGAVPLSSAYLFYEAPGNVRLGGDIDTSFLGIVRLRGRTNGELSLNLKHAGTSFNFGQDIEACIFDFICHKAYTRLSSVGVGGCYTLGPVSFGGGVRFSPFEPIIWPIDGCKWSRFESSLASARAAKAGGPLTVTVKRGDRSRAIRLDGSDGAPRVRVTAPGGQVLESPEGAGTQLTPSIRILRSQQLGATVVGLQHPRPGDYTIETMPGSPTITKISTAEDPPDARVKASVRGRGARRTLVYDVLPRPGQRVTFVETGPDGNGPIGTVSGGRGTLSFTPAPGHSPRQIEAQFQLDGIGAETRKVASFTPPSTRLGRPAHVRVRRRGATLRVSFRGVAGATRYDIVSTLTTGAQQMIQTRRRRVTIRHVAPASRGRVSVRAIASMRQGAARTARFRATAPRAPTRFSQLPRLKRRH